MDGVLSKYLNYTLIEEDFSLLQESTCEDDDTGSSVSYLVVLALGEFDQKFGDGVLYLHFLQNGGSIVSDSDILVGRNEHFIETLGTEGGFEGVGYSFGGEDILLGERNGTLSASIPRTLFLASCSFNMM